MHRARRGRRPGRRTVRWSSTSPQNSRTVTRRAFFARPASERRHPACTLMGASSIASRHAFASFGGGRSRAAFIHLCLSFLAHPPTRSVLLLSILPRIDPPSAPAPPAMAPLTTPSSIERPPRSSTLRHSTRSRRAHSPHAAQPMPSAAHPPRPARHPPVLALPIALSKPPHPLPMRTPSTPALALSAPSHPFARPLPLAESRPPRSRRSSVRAETGREPSVLDPVQSHPPRRNGRTPRPRPRRVRTPRRLACKPVSTHYVCTQNAHAMQAERRHDLPHGHRRPPPPALCRTSPTTLLPRVCASCNLAHDVRTSIADVIRAGKTRNPCVQDRGSRLAHPTGNVESRARSALARVAVRYAGSSIRSVYAC